MAPTSEPLTHEDLREARHRLGLSVRQVAALLETDQLTIRRMKMVPSRSTARPTIRENGGRQVEDATSSASASSN